MLQKDEKKEKKLNIKSRNWTILIYPDSAPTDWEDRLAGLTYCYCLHNKDKDENGNLKKAHIHVLLTFEGTVTYNTMKELTDSLTSPIPQPARSLRGTIRYLIHADNKEKYHYKREDIVSVGMDEQIEQAFENKKTDQQKQKERASMAYKLANIISTQKFFNWGQLMEYLKNLDDPELTDYTCNHAYLTTQFLTSTWREKDKQK